MTSSRYTFENIANVVDRFTEVLGLEDVRPLRLRLWCAGRLPPRREAHPERITAIVTQNGNTYLEGVSEAFAPVQAYWNDPSQANREALRGFLAPADHAVPIYPRR